ncbi:unnamed protein product [Cyprideis torosa]|uniref:Uncharacterized protein n=1 Tax=Cyprideis torosa TaxID=163714 RepID=A0A7R8WQH4_9CRUS|nr:unnamed protein product [Cyprideis torosa]CAG0907964.1 unnamed protein product [Cyprideis torosa]
MVDFLTLLTEKVQNDLITEGNLDLRGRADHDHAAETPAENKLSNKASIMAGNSREDASGVDSESVVQQEEGLKEGPERDQTSALASKIKPADVLASSIHLVSSNALQQTSKGVLGKEKKAMNHKSLEHDLLKRHSSDSDAALANRDTSDAALPNRDTSDAALPNRDTSDAALPNRDTSAKLDDKPREGEASNTEDASLDQTDLMMDTVGDESKDVFEGLSMKADEAEDASSKGSRIVKETPSLGMEEFKLVGISKDSSADQSRARFPWSEVDLCFQADGSGESWRRLVNDCYQWTGQIGKYLTAERAQRESEKRWRECLTKIMRRNDEEAEDEEDCLKRHRFLILRKVSPLTRDEMLDQGITCFSAASFATALFFLVSGKL